MTRREQSIGKAGQNIAAATLRKNDKAPLFAYYWRIGTEPSLPQPVEEFQFHPSRKWRFDFAWPDYKIAVEVDGGQWLARGGRHNTDKDREKMNAAAELGWRVFRYSVDMLKEDGAACALQVAGALDMASIPF